MKFLYSIALAVTLFSSCKLMNTNRSVPDNKALADLFNDYYEGRSRLLPVDATQNGDYRYNDKLPIDFTDSYLDTMRAFYDGFLKKIITFNRDELNPRDQISFDIFKREMEISLEGIHLHFFNTGNVAMPNLQYMPFNQFEGIPLFLGQMGSGMGVQPFNTVADYNNWCTRAGQFGAWADSAIVYFKKGIANGYVLPHCLVVKMIPQMEAMITPDPTTSLFYGPAKRIPASFTEEEKAMVTNNLVRLIRETLSPAYQRLAEFLQKEYLPRSRASIGFEALPDGNRLYHYLIRFWTTTNNTPEEIYQTGLSEVKRIRLEMEQTKASTGYSGSLPDFFNYLKTDKRFMPYKKTEDVLNAFRKIQQTIDPNLKKLFGRTPKMKFEIRQTEAFRAASASAEYNPGSIDGSRPGIFYVPILDATKFNITSGMESLFLHEAIPGHHYQTALQIEDTLLPKFRRLGWYGAYGEGWALYCESLGKELGLYTDPYQYMGALGDDMHRAVRLVVDVAMHENKMSREEAIRYMMENEAISEQGATAEIERYIAIPAQALSYKTGALKIRELRTRYSEELGNRFNIAAFHDEVLSGGCMPLDVFERKMDAWEKRQ